MEFNFDPVAFSVFGIEIRWYALIIIAGMLLGTYFAKKEYVRRGFDEDFIYDVLFVIIPIGILGARFCMRFSEDTWNKVYQLLLFCFIQF